MKGKLPEGWKFQIVSDFLERITNSVNVKTSEIYREIGIRSHGKGIFHKAPVSGKQLGNKRVFFLEPNCFVVNIVFAWEQAIAKTSDSEIGMIASHRFPMYKPKKDRCDINFILYLFKTEYGKQLLELASPGGAGRNKTLGQSAFLRLALLLPPLPEQKKIAEILSTWDKAISTTEKLLANSQKQKKALMQQLLTGKKRLLDENGVRFCGGWKSLRFSDLVSLSKTKLNPKLKIDLRECIELEHISSATSTILDSTTTLTAISTKSVFRTGNILFGKLRPYLRKYWLANRDGVCSTEIWVFVTNEGFTIPEYLFQWIQMDYFIDAASKSSGTRMPRADWSIVRDLPLLIPSFKEQQKIATVLSAADREIETLQQKIQYLKQEKKALMQQLLTGKRRVKVG